MNTTYKWIMRCFALVIVNLHYATSHAAVFSIVPQRPLPTSLPKGSTAIAYYTVTNTTGSFHASNYVKYLPSNVTQVTVDNTVPNLCGSTFALAANASCILELYITGAVQASNPNPRDHLFVCLGGCITCCAGTNFPLNVTTSSPLPVIAAGNYAITTTPYLYPLLATSRDGGSTWAYTIDSSTPALPADYYSQSTTSGFNDTSCAGSNCIAVGSYQTNATNNPAYPLLANSTNGGVIWAYTIDRDTALSVPSDYTSTGSFRAASCAGLDCIAVGSYETTKVNNPIYPLVAHSVNGGLTWAYTIDSQTNPSVPTDFKNFAAFSSTSCTDFTCIAAGVYTSTKHPFTSYPLLASSADAGVTWTYTIDSNTNPSVPAGFTTYGIFNSSDCSGLICVAVGEYLGSFQYPLIASSSDSGLSWAYTLYNAQPVLPADYVLAGNFNSVSISTPVLP